MRSPKILHLKLYDQSRKVSQVKVVVVQAVVVAVGAVEVVEVAAPQMVVVAVVKAIVNPQKVAKAQDQTKVARSESSSQAMFKKSY